MVEPKAVPCPHCDFSSGQRGMDRCAKCDGTGSQLHVRVNGVLKRFPNTEFGHSRAMRAQQGRDD